MNQSTQTSTSTPPIVAASYERVSTRNQGQHGFSLGAQHRNLEDFAESQGWVLPEHLRFRDGEDEAASGADWDLPGLTKMLEAARSGAFTILAVPDLDRFARSLVKGLVLEEQLRMYGVRVVYQRVPTDGSPEGNLLKTQLFAFSEYEREKTRLRTMGGRRAKAQTGQVVGAGVAPFGFRFTRTELSNGKMRTSGLERNPATGPVALRILRDLRSLSTADIAHALNAEGIPGPRGGQWLPSAVHRIAVDPVYSGWWLYGKRGRRVLPDDSSSVAVPVPAFIGRDEWDQLQRALTRRRSARRGRMVGDADPYVLRGRLTCGHCRAGLHTKPNSNIRYYGCLCRMPSGARRSGRATCSLPDVHAADLEAELWRILGATLLDHDFLTAGLDGARVEHERAGGVRRERLAVVDAEIGRQRKRLDNVSDSIADAGDGEARASLLRRAKDVEQLIGQLSAERAALEAVRSKGLSPAEAASVERFAAEITDGLAKATGADHRAVCDALQIQGRVYLDPSGVRIGRKHAFRIEWEASIPLRNNDAFLRTPGIESLYSGVTNKRASAAAMRALKVAISGVSPARSRSSSYSGNPRRSTSTISILSG